MHSHFPYGVELHAQPIIASRLPYRYRTDIQETKQINHNTELKVLRKIAQKSSRHEVGRSVTRKDGEIEPVNK
jgi:hypothetical protein